MTNSVDPDQTAPSGAVWSGYALFAYVILSETLVFEILGHLPYIDVVWKQNYSTHENKTNKANSLLLTTKSARSIRLEVPA